MADRSTLDVSGRWHGGMKFAFDDGYGHRLIVDAPDREGEPFDGFMPAHLLLASLAACTGIDITNILRKQRQELASLGIEVSGVQKPAAPWAFKEIHLEYKLQGRKLDDRAVQRAIQLAEDKYCSIGATIGGVAAITSSHSVSLQA